MIDFLWKGTTWVQEIMSAVIHDGDLEEVNKRHTVFRVPFLEMSLPSKIRKDHNVSKGNREGRCACIWGAHNKINAPTYFRFWRLAKGRLKVNATQIQS